MSHSSPRKIVKGKRVLPSVPPESPRLKSVTFNDETVETSIGGTQKVGKIRKDLFLQFDNPKRLAKSSVASRTAKDAGPHLNKTTQPPGKENKEVVSSKVSPPSDQNSLCHGSPDDPKIFSGSPSSTGDKVEEEFLASPVKGKTMMKMDTAPKVVLENGDQKPGKVINPSSKLSATETVTIIQSVPSGGKSKASNDVSGDASRRTTQEHVNIVAESPFRTPNAKQSRRHTLESKLFATPDCYRDVNFGTPRRLLPSIQDESMETQDDGEDSCSITVAVRVRPFSQRELADSNTRCAISMQGNETVLVTDNGTLHRFAYEFSFWSHDKTSPDFSDQETVYTKLAQPLLGKAFEGYNTCLFAYGQTGSGKSYSVMGNVKDQGIIPRFCCSLFNRIHTLTLRKKIKINVEISFFEIYNEKIHDLLAGTKEKGAKKATLKVREHPVLGPYVEGLSTFVVNSFEDVEGWITLGNKNRATASTGMNDKSSRSHSVFTIVLTQTKTEVIEGQEHEHSVNSKINLVDLAGSERQSLANNTTGERLREGANINKSLLTLGKVISLLSERSTTSKKRKIFIPYRDSVLTWLLKESLGGNSKTTMMATISPSNQHIEETLSTLRYAQQARSIVNVVRVNEDPKAKIIRQLRAEIERLRGEQGGGAMNEEALAASMCEVARLRTEMEELSRSWQERLKQAETRKAEELQLLERAGIAFKVDNKLPNLVNLNEDPQLSEMLLYVIKEGQTRVGRKTGVRNHDIQLTGALIADDHCLIQNMKGVVDITPSGDAPTYVNGSLVVECTKLHHGDRVILGGDHFFRFNHPMEVRKNKNTGEAKGSTLEIKDFDFARQELHRVQEERLQAELEEELDKTRKELTQQKNGYETKLKGLEEELSSVEQTQKEAQTTIHSLKKQNMMLEQEVLAGRKRQQTEINITQQTIDELSKKSRIVELLEAEKCRVAERLERLRSKRSELVTPTQLTSTQESPIAMAAKSPGRRRDLYKVALLLREANKINQYLSTNLMFIREDTAVDPDIPDTTQTHIRVINSHHRMSTLWPIPKFEEKLAQMRDLFQNGGDISVDDEEIFNDPEDVWEKDVSMIMTSPGSLTNSLKGLCKSPVAVMRSQVTTLRKGSLDFTTRGTNSSLENVVHACKLQMSSACDNLSALNFEESIPDKLLVACQRILANATSVVELCSDAKKWADNAVDSGDRGLTSSVTQLSTDVQLMASFVTLWSTLYDGAPSTQFRDLISRSSDQVKAIGHQLTSLLQGCQGRLTSLVCESGHKVRGAVLSLCHTSGQLTLATDCSVLHLDQPVQDLVSSDVCHQFLVGCNHFVVKTLNGCLLSLEAYENKCVALKTSYDNSSEICQRVSHVISCVRALLQRNMQVQEELQTQEEEIHRLQRFEEEEDEEDEEGGGKYPGVCSTDRQSLQMRYGATFKRLQGILVHASAVVDSTALVVQSTESVAQGQNQDGKRLERCAALILKSSQRLVAASLHSSRSSSLSSSSGPMTFDSKNSPVHKSSTFGSQSSPSITSSLSTSSSNLASTFGTPSTVSTPSIDSRNRSRQISMATPDGHNTDLDNNHDGSGGFNDTDLTEVTMLSDSQVSSLDAALQEVTMAVSMFVEHVRKTWTRNANSAHHNGCATPSGLLTPRGKRLLPASPEKSVVTPAVGAAHLKKLNMQRTMALASQGSFENSK